MLKGKYSSLDLSYSTRRTKVLSTVRTLAIVSVYNLPAAKRCIKLVDRLIRDRLLHPGKEEITRSRSRVWVAVPSSISPSYPYRFSLKAASNFPPKLKHLIRSIKPGLAFTMRLAATTKNYFPKFICFKDKIKNTCIRGKIRSKATSSGWD